MKRVFLILCLCLGGTVSFAQSAMRNKTEKEPRANSLEITGGALASFFTAKGDVKNTIGLAGGGDFSYRYTRFFKNGYGAFIQMGVASFYADEMRYFGAMNKADGEKYLYRSNSSDYSIDYSPMLIVGGLYSFDFDSFSIRPRIGIGFSDRDEMYYSYERRSRNGVTGPEYFTLKSVAHNTPKVDYLIDNYTDYATTTAVLDASVQMIFRPKSLFSFFLEAGFIADVTRMQVEKTSVSSKLMYSPSSWPEAISTYGSKDVWTRDSATSKVVYEPFVPGPMFTMNFGVAVNFGKFNR